MKLAFEDLKVGMSVKIHQSYSIREIIEIDTGTFQVVIAQRQEDGSFLYKEKIHWKNLSKMYFNGKWMTIQD